MLIRRVTVKSMIFLTKCFKEKGLVYCDLFLGGNNWRASCLGYKKRRIELRNVEKLLSYLSFTP